MYQFIMTSSHLFLQVKIPWSYLRPGKVSEKLRPSLNYADKEKRSLRKSKRTKKTKTTKLTLYSLFCLLFVILFNVETFNYCKEVLLCYYLILKKINMQHFHPKIYICLLSFTKSDWNTVYEQNWAGDFWIHSEATGSHLLSIPYNCAFKLNSNKIIQINQNTLKSSPLLTAVAYYVSYVC